MVNKIKKLHFVFRGVSDKKTRYFVDELSDQALNKNLLKSGITARLGCQIGILTGMISAASSGNLSTLTFAVSVTTLTEGILNIGMLFTLSNEKKARNHKKAELIKLTR